MMSATAFFIDNLIHNTGVIQKDEMTRYEVREYSVQPPRYLVPDYLPKP